MVTCTRLMDPTKYLACSTGEARKMDPTAVIGFHQADVGEYLRNEDTLFVGESTSGARADKEMETAGDI
jgi:hypothetical protein